MSPRWGFIFGVTRFYTDVAPLGLKTRNTETTANPRHPCNPRQSAIQTNYLPSNSMSTIFFLHSVRLQTAPTCVANY